MKSKLFGTAQILRAGAMALGLTAAVSAAQAAEIVVYEDAYYRGASRTFTGDVRDLQNRGFNDTISSVRVISGTWTICNDSNFNGRCMRVNGDLANLDPIGNNDQVSSIRLDSGGGSGGSGGSASGDIVFFDAPGYSGVSVGLNTDNSNFGNTGLNDRATSIRVYDGVWEVCQHANYGGYCVEVDSDVPFLGALSIDNNISSARRVDVGETGPSDWFDRWQNGREDRWERWEENQNSEAEIYGRANYEGRRRLITEAVPDLSTYRFNDRASSIRVAGRWRVCDEVNYGGDCRVIRFDEADLNDTGWNDRISSMQPVGRRGAGRQGLVMFEDANFEGDRERVTSDVADLRDIGFSDVASSLRVRSGRWEVCDQAGYRGRCAIYDANVRDLAPTGLDDRIRSVREVGAATPPPAPEPEGDIVIYQHVNYRGESRALNGNVRRLNSIGFNDTLSSFRVFSGTWELCEDNGYRGRCWIVDADENNVVPLGMNDAISSIRRVEDTTLEDAGISIFEHVNYQGRGLLFEEDVPNLGPFNFNDMLSSFRISDGEWELCEHSNYRGRCWIFRSDQANVVPWGLNDSISSMRRIDGGGVGPGSSYDTGISIYEDRRFRGRELHILNAMPNLAAFDFNDMMTSFRIHDGVWEFCEDANYRGRCWQSDQDERNVSVLGFDDTISSLRRIGSTGGSSGGSAPGGSRLVAYQHVNYAGNSRTYTGSVANLSADSFNDTISSFEIYGTGDWEICEGAGYSGRCQVFTVSAPTLVPLNWNDRVSSIRYLP